MTFEEFWKLYPRRLDKLCAQRAWKKIKTSEMSALIAGLQAWKAYWVTKEMEYVPYPATWLNKRRWEDLPTNQGMTKHEQRTYKNLKAAAAYAQRDSSQVAANPVPALQGGSDRGGLLHLGDGITEDRPKKA